MDDETAPNDTANGGTANGGTANGGTANGGTANAETANGGRAADEAAAYEDDDAFASLDSVLVTASLVLGRPLTIVPSDTDGNLTVKDELTGATVFSTPVDDPLAVAELELQLSDLANGRARFLYTKTGTPYIGLADGQGAG